MLELIKKVCTNGRVVIAVKIIFIIVFLMISLCNGDVDGVLRAVTTLLLS